MLWDVVQRADDLTQSEGDTLFSLLLSFEDVFATDSSHTTVIKHTIDTGSAQPVQQPSMKDTLDTLAGSKWFITFDLLSRYWQVELDEKRL